MEFLPYSYNSIFQKKVLILCKIIGPSAILTQGFATSDILTEIHQSRILVPALQSKWLIMHVMITFRKNIKFFYKINGFLKEPFFLGENVVENTSVFCAKNYYRSQLIQQLDYWSYRESFRERYGLYSMGVLLELEFKRNLGIYYFDGFLIIWICYFGVNLLGIGLHSYGSFPSTFN
ncbi:hypothetical protein H5410_003308 [Solanum commersonii]|uniref:Uncharacterized protein n=1 Tax=Solanum commersonii TaxID=4109 RepID=A0A9J6B5A5_SOLCO|nr:hypothetical protein H5410_003308 [Solanum commersonii]